jgi:hypothetical protein
MANLPVKEVYQIDGGPGMMTMHRNIIFRLALYTCKTWFFQLLWLGILYLFI